MLECMTDVSAALPATTVLAGIFETPLAILLIVAGFSFVIFTHELGHFAVAKWAGVKVEKFAIGFGKEIIGFTRGETRYSFNILPLGGYVRMLGQDDFAVDANGDLVVKDDPRAFGRQPVGRRMMIVSAGVVMNLIFAALLFMLVFMIGREAPVPVIGAPLPGSPADKAGLQYGDRILEVNGKPVRDYFDFKMAIVLAEPHTPLNLKIGRDGKVIAVRVTPQNDPEKNVLQIGVPPKYTNLLVAVAPEPGPPRPDSLQPGDEIVEVNGRPVRDFFEVYHQLRAARGARITIVVNRPDPKDPSKKERVTCSRRAWVDFEPTEEGPNAVGHLLGLVPRRKVVRVAPGGRADLAGIREGDVIVEWNGIVGPTFAEVAASIEANPEKDLPVVVERDGRQIRTTVRPKRTGLFGRGKPEVGIGIGAQEEEPVVVARLATEPDGRPTAASGLCDGGIPAGAVITKADGQAIHTWNDLALKFFEAAGGKVVLTWKVGNQPEQTTTMRIPADITTIAQLPPAAEILSIGGRDSIEIAQADGRGELFSASYWRGAYEILKAWQVEHPGQPVTICYRDVLDPARTVVSKQVVVPPDAVDPWTMRVRYADYLQPDFERIVVQTWNPAKALWIGVAKTYGTVLENYTAMRRMIFTRSVGVENISGPVGIISLGMAAAKAGVDELFYLLGFLSVGLAVLNFLPLPIVDGGLMVFLIIEKIKGRPVSLKTQAATQVIGLALLAAAFILVTYNDFYKLFAT